MSTSWPCRLSEPDLSTQIVPNELAGIRAVGAVCEAATLKPGPAQDRKQGRTVKFIVKDLDGKDVDDGVASETLDPR
jgi:hypothetical protein